MEDLDAILSAIVGSVIERLGSGSVKSVSGLEKDLGKLKKQFLMIADVLSDVESRFISNEGVRSWLRKVKDAAYDADDVLDDFCLLEAQQRIQSLRSSSKKVLGFSLRNRFSRFKTAHKIKNLSNRIDELALVCPSFRPAGGSRESKASPASASLASALELEMERRSSFSLRETSNILLESEVSGRNEDIQIITGLLLSADEDKDLSVLPIVGMGGVGKTTLAQMIYRDKRMEEHFDLRLWVYVGESFDVKRIVQEMLEDAGRIGDDVSSPEAMQQLLSEHVMDKRFLLVLDDVWSEDAAKWKLLKSMLRGGRHGSKILVTTRSEVVGRMMCTAANPYRIKGISDDDCWTLFRERAFGTEEMAVEEEMPNLVMIGKKIVRKCGGLPLAVRTIGALLRSKRNEEEWLAVLDNVAWESSGYESEILPALRLSYNCLPPNLKQIFAYCSMFPKDYEIGRLKLIQLWVAEGFIHLSPEEGLLAEDIGNQYFHDLLSRSFFHDPKFNDFGQIDSFKIHDIMHDFAQYVARDDFSVSTIDRKRTVVVSTRYSSVILEHDTEELILNLHDKAKALRSLLLFSPSIGLKKFELDLAPLSYLRVLDASGLTISESYLHVLGKLIHLRYLSLSHTSIQALPDSIASLHNLQTLNLKNCWKLRELPKSIWGLINLRHLDIYGCSSLTRMPLGMGRLQSIQTLPLFIVGKEPGRTISELQNLNLISGELKIRCLSNVKHPAEAMKANLQEKVSVQSLVLDWEGLRDDEGMPLISKNLVNDDDVLKNLVPQPNLRHLAISGYKGSRFPDWLSSMLPELVKLLLNRCPRGNWFLPEQEHKFLPSLKFLEISDCPELRVESHLPLSLIELVIQRSDGKLLAGGSLQGLSNLRNLYISDMTSTPNELEGLQYLTSLEVLKIQRCHHLDRLPEIILHLSSLRTLELDQNNNLKSLEVTVAGCEVQRPRFCGQLHHLKILSSRGLTALAEWIGDLTALRSLEIRWCKNLSVLPDGLQRLTALSQLTIYDCPLLLRRLDVKTGEDWRKIVHIQNIYIAQTEELE